MKDKRPALTEENLYKVLNSPGFKKALLRDRVRQILRKAAFTTEVTRNVDSQS